MTGALPAQRTLPTARVIRVRLVCRTRRHRMDGDLQRLSIDRRFADTPFTRLSGRCAKCGIQRAIFGYRPTVTPSRHAEDHRGSSVRIRGAARRACSHA